MPAGMSSVGSSAGEQRRSAIMDKVKPAWIVAPVGTCLLFLALQPARAEVQNCTNITAIPATISTQGVYCLKQHVSAALASGAAITINVNK